MNAFVRALIAVVVFAAVYFFTFWGVLSIVPFVRDIQIFGSVLSLAAGLAAAWFVFTRSRAAPSGLFGSMAYGAAVIGAISFSAGFFGPILFVPDSNQGPLLGILITGPLGVLAGAAVGGVVWALRRRGDTVSDARQ